MLSKIQLAKPSAMPNSHIHSALKDQENPVQTSVAVVLLLGSRKVEERASSGSIPLSLQQLGESVPALLHTFAALHSVTRLLPLRASVWLVVDSQHEA